MNPFEEQTLEALERIEQRVANVEAMVFADISREAREVARRVVEEELGRVRDEW